MKSNMSLYINLYNKRTVMLLPTVLLLGMLSCRKADIVQPTINTPDKAVDLLLATSSTQHLIFEETFESGTPFTSYATLQTGTSYAFTVCSTNAFEGSKSGRFELRDTDPMVSSGTRAEAKFPIQDNLNRWYSYSVYFPSSDYAYDSKAEIISQWHQGGGVSPSMSLITRYDKLIFESRTVPKEKTQYGLGSIVKDKWQTFVLHIIHSHGSDGLVEIWKDGVKIFTHQGANSYDMNTYEWPKWKMGLYKWDWNGTETTDVKKRVIYFDDVRLGNEKAVYADMVSGTTVSSPIVPATDTIPTTTTQTGSTTNAPSTLGISSFVLINSATEKEVVNITEGATISLAKYGLTKTNISAKPTSGTGSIKFSLSGPQSKNSTDNASPYALMGDDGLGNYYFGSWNPPATGYYTLKATPYSSDDASGTIGTSATVHFTITK